MAFLPANWLDSSTSLTLMVTVGQHHASVTQGQLANASVGCVSALGTVQWELKRSPSMLLAHDLLTHIVNKHLQTAQER